MVEPGAASSTPGPQVDEDTIAFVMDDPNRGLHGVRLEQELGIPCEKLDFGYDEPAGRWTLALPRPPVLRMEYRLRLRHADGSIETINDPAAASRAPGAFGEKSVLEMPGYAAPVWLREGRRWEPSIELRVPTSDGPIDVTVLSPEAPARRLLVVHDGPEYDQLANLGEFAASMVHAGRVLPFHLALAAPGPRDQRYSVNPGYGTALAARVIPALHRRLRTDGPAVLMGASLGALAALHVQRRHPHGIGGLFLQSGSFFLPENGEHSSDSPHHRRITCYVASLHRAERATAPVPAVLTCGAMEENVHNNRLMAAALRRQGYPVTLHEVPDAHNFTAWRDAFDPYLVDLLNTVWGAGTP
jgi:enterochelin esterase-like enzyme